MGAGEVGWGEDGFSEGEVFSGGGVGEVGGELAVEVGEGDGVGIEVGDELCAGAGAEEGAAMAGEEALGGERCGSDFDFAFVDVGEDDGCLAIGADGDAELGAEVDEVTAGGADGELVDGFGDFDGGAAVVDGHGEWAVDGEAAGGFEGDFDAGGEGEGGESGFEEEGCV